jgi:hypothetical protein
MPKPAMYSIHNDSLNRAFLGLIQYCQLFCWERVGRFTFTGLWESAGKLPKPFEMV